MKKTPEYLLMAERCSECLVTKDRVVGGERAAEIVREVRAKDIKFICHKAQIAGLENVACRGVHDITGGCQAYRMARGWGIPVVEIDPKTMERRP